MCSMCAGIQLPLSCTTDQERSESTPVILVSLPLQAWKKENLTKDDIYTIVEAVLDVMEAYANPELESDLQTIPSSGCQITNRSDDIRFHHVRETKSIANDTRADSPSTTDQDVGDYNYVLFTIA